MAGNIKGITIELNGDTTKLDKALRSVGRETQTLQRQLSDVGRLTRDNDTLSLAVLEDTDEFDEDDEGDIEAGDDDE